MFRVLSLSRDLPDGPVALGVLLEAADKVVEVLLPRGAALEGAPLQVGVVFLEELLFSWGDAVDEEGATDADEGAAGLGC